MIIQKGQERTPTFKKPTQRELKKANTVWEKMTADPERRNMNEVKIVHVHLISRITNI